MPLRALHHLLLVPYAIETQISGSITQAAEHIEAERSVIIGNVWAFKYHLLEQKCRQTDEKYENDDCDDLLQTCQLRALITVVETDKDADSQLEVHLVEEASCKVVHKALVIGTEHSR